MLDTVRRLVWFSIVATAASFAVFLVLGNFATAGAENEGPVPVRDVVTAGAHQLTGMLLLPLSCDELSVEPEQISGTVYELAFETWQDPSVPCAQTPTPRSFEAVVFAPSVGVSFTAALDGQMFPIQILPDFSTSSPL